MRIYLVRHGEAVPAEVDPKRPLSARGRNEVEGAVRELMAEGAKISEIWHSEKLRAKQTAQIIARDLGIKVVIEKKGLKPDDDPGPIADLLRAANKTILIAGHLPFLPKLAKLLDPKMGKVELGTGEVVKIS
ncbi:MAG: histidine phosphatase family protein [bacterium]